MTPVYGKSAAPPTATVGSLTLAGSRTLRDHADRRVCAHRRGRPLSENDDAVATAHKPQAFRRQGRDFSRLLERERVGLFARNKVLSFDRKGLNVHDLPPQGRFGDDWISIGQSGVPVS